MNTLIKFPKLAPDTTTNQGCNVTENRRTGYRLMYCSMKDAPWYRNLAKKAVWVHLIFDVAYESTSVTFGSNRIDITRGQLVCSAKSLGAACGVSADQARRALEYFEQEGAISLVTKQGKGGYTVVSILNFDAYQRGVSQHFTAEYGAEFEAASDKGLEADRILRSAELPAELDAEYYNNITIIKDPTEGASACAEPPCIPVVKNSPKHTPYQSILEAYHELLPGMPGIRDLTDSRKTKIRTFWHKFGFTEDRWRKYLQFIAANCRWMCESRDRGNGQSWKPKNLDFLITERCYLGVREGRFND